MAISASEIFGFVEEEDRKRWQSRKVTPEETRSMFAAMAEGIQAMGQDVTKAQMQAEQVGRAVGEKTQRRRKTTRVITEEVYPDPSFSEPDF